MSSCVFCPAWFSRITWSTLAAANARSFRRMVSGDPISPAVSACCAFSVWRQSW